MSRLVRDRDGTNNLMISRPAGHGEEKTKTSKKRRTTMGKKKTTAKTAAPTKKAKGVNEDTLKSVQGFVKELIEANKGCPILKRAAIYKSAVEKGFENKVIYRYMLHPAFKAAERGTYDASKALVTEDNK